MLLAVDIGNSATKFGVFDGDRLTSRFSITTNREISPEGLRHEIGDRLGPKIDAAIACSVVPEIDDAVSRFIADAFDIKARFVLSTHDVGLTINFPVTTTGVDRLVNSFAAAEKYGVPCVVLSLGTATTLDVVSETREYLGGLIAPGMMVNARALSLATSKLPEVNIKKPPSVVAQTTETAIQSGIVNGHIAMIKGLVERIKKELFSESTGQKPMIVATGGFALLIADEVSMIDTVDPDLTLMGLMILYRRAVAKTS